MKKIELSEKIINVSGINTRYRVVGESNKKVLIIHGWGATSYSWRNISYCLAKNGYESIALDLPGFGETPPPDNVWGVDEYVNFLVSFIKELNLDNFYLIGHSFGGSLSLKLTYEKPKLINKLVLCDAAIIRKQRLNTRQRITKAISHYGSKIVSRTPFYSFFEKIAYWFAGAYDYYQANGIMKEIFKKVINQDLSNIASKIKKECLIAWGQFDQATPLEDAFVLNELIENSKLRVIRESGHNPHRSHKEELCKILVEFFNK
jgi:pimeloyl-ACP methyl ester carboxylesterase